MESQSNDLSKLIIDEIIVAVGLPKNRISRFLFWPFFHKITDRLAFFLRRLDQDIGEEGLPEASAWLLTNFCSSIQMRGEENIPKEGPLLVVTNHPGTYDGLIVFSGLKRNDIQWVSNDIPAIHLLNNVQKHVLYASRKNISDHFIVLRNSIRHLREGGTLMYIGSGGRDPDPAVYSGADEFIDHWLNTFETFFKYTKELRILPVVVSHVISKQWANHPVTRLRRERHWKLVLAEFSQVIYQLSHPGKLMLSPMISFGKSYSEVELRSKFGGTDLRSAVISLERSLMHEHLSHHQMIQPTDS